MNRLLGLVPARAGSRRVPDKNVRPLAGGRLLERAVDCALAARGLDCVGLSTDSEHYRAIAAARGLAERYLRPAALAGDDATSAAVALDYVDWRATADGIAVSHVVLLQPTSPFRTAADVERAIALWRRSGRASLVSVTACAPKPELVVLVAEGAGRRVPAGVTSVCALDGAIYITPVEQLRRSGRFWDEQSALYTTVALRPWDIDTEADFAAADALLRLPSLSQQG